MACGAALPDSQDLLGSAKELCMPGCAPAAPPQPGELGIEVVPLPGCRYPAAFQLAEEALGEPAVSGPRVRPLLM